MAKQRKKQSRSPMLVFVVAVVVLVVTAYVRTRPGPGVQTVSGGDAAKPPVPVEVESDHDPAQTVDKEDSAGGEAALSHTAPSPGALPWMEDKPSPPADPNQMAEQLQAGRDARTRDDLVAARSHLSKALLAGVQPQDAAAIRQELVSLAEETIFSSRVLQDDPLTDAYVIQPGDSLARIAQAHDVTADLLARINEIENKALIRAGRRIKVIHGPFHAVVSKSTFDLDVYLQDTFVKHFKVGLGTDGCTPTGDWICKDKLPNPTFYPPRGGQIIPGGHPENPLGERWIGLKGVGGEAVGQLRYGLHGTIEPDTIGKAVSMGCIRMHNREVEQVYEMFVEGQSHILVRE
ncbi:MAG: L,D-transpeptidase family protein [Phycisphaerales bacterium]|nr:MAG: L,D-transpeptidase family protein [Phycisphaerales bacterium]